jgi:hypothetical protein
VQSAIWSHDGFALSPYSQSSPTRGHEAPFVGALDGHSALPPPLPLPLLEPPLEEPPLLEPPLELPPDPLPELPPDPPPELLPEPEPDPLPPSPGKPPEKVAPPHAHIVANTALSQILEPMTDLSPVE